MRISKNYDGTVTNDMGELIPSEYGNFLEPGESGEISNLHDVQTWSEISRHSGGSEISRHSGGCEAMSMWKFWLGVWAIIIMDFCYGYFTTGSCDEALHMILSHLWFLIKGFFCLILLINGLVLGSIIYIWQFIFG